ncbi:MAG: TonB-dependent receptor [Candidatus Eisenbacteria bacterium]|uniref:TonB-dependent receptor n=1 Tax=Eiseniibacteriota bacterium TaxID=2212470 RepID=A0A956NAC8_UNCEI|nr:TonB-dependent receptor [Candidatus Eisenbacteria bacterium]MCB9463507.1 TonB-dependent receptor [Candidatus Eisenbacteria bacterium]
MTETKRIDRGTTCARPTDRVRRKRRTARAIERTGLLSSLALVVVLCLALVPWAPALAGTTGKVIGRVTSDSGEPVSFANVIVPGAGMVFTDEDGDYVVLNVPPGVHEVRVSRIGFAATTVTNVEVASDLSTRIDVVLPEELIGVEEVTITAERLPVDLGVTNSRAVISSSDIEALPVQELEELVNLQAGVVDGHFRGGRIGEVQYQVDGISVNNLYDNKSSLTLDRSILQEVQVISGTFDAEYGQAMSGVVNAVLKTGTDTFEYGAEALTGAYVFPGNSERIVDDEIELGAIQNYQVNLSGPLPVGKTVYLLSGRRAMEDSYVQAVRTFVPTDSSNFQDNLFYPTGDGKKSALGYNRVWSGVAKLTNSSIPSAKISYQAIVEKRDGRADNWAFRYNPDGLSKNHTVSVSHGLDWTQTLNTSSYIDFGVRQNYFHYEDFVYEDVYDPRYDAAGQVLADDLYEPGAFIQGVQFNRFEQKTNALMARLSYTNQLSPTQQIKIGTELDLPVVEFGTPGHLTYTTVNGEQTLVRYVDSPPDWPGVQSYDPVRAAAFVQEQLEWSDLLVRAGVRFDYFDARSSIPSDLANPANIIDGAPESVPQSTTAKTSYSPRLGVSYPILDRAAIHFAYGHFRQFPSIGQIFQNADYSILTNLQASETSYGVLGNPDVSPETTVQYELGYKHAFSLDLGTDLTVFYKDIRDLLGVEFISTYNDAEYARLTNVDFGEVTGFTFSLDHHALGPVSVFLDYTWQRALGNASDPRETATRASAGEDPRPRLIPFNWDQRHTFNATVTLSSPDSYTASAILRVASGQPYTPIIESGFGNGLDANSGRKPTGFLLDLRAERSMGDWFGGPVSVFGRVFNAFDTRYFGGSVFASTGSPYYSRFTAADEIQLGNPTRFQTPRRVEIGLRLESGS